MNSLSIKLVGIAKEFNRRPIFADIHFSVAAPGSLALTGKNGSGKSTLAKIVAGVLTPTHGIVQYLADGRVLTPGEWKWQLGFVSPYLNLYDEFSAYENLILLSRIRARRPGGPSDIQSMLDRVGLGDRIHDPVREFSSGMKQRLKYAFALLHNPRTLILDEPTSNLDSDGIEFVREVVAEQRRSGILIVATNDSNEASWCERRVRLG